MNPGFLIVGRAGAAELRVCGGGPPGQPLVTFAQDEGCLVVLLGRLYYRDHLLDFTGGLTPRRSPSPMGAEAASNAAALALALYRAQGRTGLERLEGDFALALWDATAQCLLGMRDPLGGYPLFWCQRDGTIALGTTLTPLLNLLGSRSLDEEYLADLLMAPRPIQEVPGERCVYRGIHRVTAGTLVALAVHTGAVERRVFWDWGERRVDPGPTSLEEAAARYGDLLRSAVRERLSGRVAAHLSGGMDSTAVALVARDWTVTGVTETPLHTLSLVYERVSWLARETPYVDLALQGQAGLVAHRIAADDLLDYDGFGETPPTNEPYGGLKRWPLDQALIGAAAGCGATTMLTGIGADEVLDRRPLYLTELLRRGRFLTAWREAARWARATSNSPWEILYPSGIANLLPAWLRGGLKPLLRGGYAELRAQNAWTIPPWVRRDFARRHDLRGRALDNLRRTYYRTPSPELSYALAAIESKVGDVNRWSLAAPLGLGVAHPFLDSRVLCFGLGLLGRLRPDPERLKPVLADAMREVLPDAIRNRRRKGDFNEVYYLGLSRNLPRLEALLRRAPLEDLGLFDRAVLSRSLQDAALGVAEPFPLHRLNVTLALLVWLVQPRREEPSPTEVIRLTRPVPVA